MLSIPRGFQPSEKAHNIDNATFLDWVEATMLIAEEELSPTNIIDYLIEEQLYDYDNQDFASEYVSSGWADLKGRLSWLGCHSPIIFDDRWMMRRLEWTEVPAHSFCLIVSFGPRYDDWGADFGPDYTKQGELFELVTKAAMEMRFSGWQFLHTGWGRDKTSKLPDVVSEITSYINEPIGNIEDYASEQANEAGVDLVWHLPFADIRGGAPVYLAQCASGKNWIDKVSEPDIKEWTKFIDFAGVPSKAFSLPFSLDDREMRRQSNRAGGLLLDRYRLLAHGVSESEWVPDTLRHDLINWLDPRIDWIVNRGY